MKQLVRDLTDCLDGFLNQIFPCFVSPPDIRARRAAPGRAPGVSLGVR